MWPCESVDVALLLYGWMAMWLCGCVAVWLCGYVAMQLCGYVAILNFVRTPCPVDAYYCHGPMCFCVLCFSF